MLHKNTRNENAKILQSSLLGSRGAFALTKGCSLEKFEMFCPWQHTFGSSQFLIGGLNECVWSILSPTNLIPQHRVGCKQSWSSWDGCSSLLSCEVHIASHVSGSSVVWHRYCIWPLESLEDKSSTGENNGAKRGQRGQRGWCIHQISRILSVTDRRRSDRVG